MIKINKRGDYVAGHIAESEQPRPNALLCIRAAKASYRDTAAVNILVPRSAVAEDEYTITVSLQQPVEVIAERDKKGTKLVRIRPANPSGGVYIIGDYFRPVRVPSISNIVAFLSGRSGSGASGDWWCLLQLAPGQTAVIAKGWRWRREFFRVRVENGEMVVEKVDGEEAERLRKQDFWNCFIEDTQETISMPT